MKNKHKPLYKEIKEFVLEEQSYQEYYSHSEKQAVIVLSKKLLKRYLYDDIRQEDTPVRYWFYLTFGTEISEMLIEEKKEIETVMHRSSKMSDRVEAWQRATGAYHV